MKPPRKEPKTQPCTVCSGRSLPGLVRGQGKCRYHWTVAVWGKAWADELERRSEAKS